MNLSVKQLDILYNITDGTVTKNDLIQRIGKARYDYYYPLYCLIKLHTLKDRFRWYIQRKRKNSVNCWVMKCSKNKIIKKRIQNPTDKKELIKTLFPNNFEVITTQHKTGIMDYYCCFIDSEEGGEYNKVADWFKFPDVLPTGNYLILHKKWINGEECDVPIRITPTEMKKLFSN